MSYGIDIFDSNGVKLVGFDNPTCIIDDVARIEGQVPYDPPIVTGFSVKFHDSLVKAYPQRSGVARLVCVGKYRALTQLNSRPYCTGWLVLEVG